MTERLNNRQEFPTGPEVPISLQAASKITARSTSRLVERRTALLAGKRKSPNPPPLITSLAGLSHLSHLATIGVNEPE